MESSSAVGDPPLQRFKSFPSPSRNATKRTTSETEETPSSLQSRIDLFKSINEKPVDDISLEFFYKPHTITLLTVICVLSLYTVFVRDDSDRNGNIWAGLKAFTFIFLVISVLAFPNGPFYRPHPAVWRLSFGLSVLYLLMLQFILFQSFKDVKAMMRWFDPVGLNQDHLEEKDYALNCSDVTFARIWSHLDIFAASHFIGWALKAMLIRHYAICWYISVTWEITEIAFSHLLPNFQECWWDAIGLDVLLCNGLGIWFGMFICKKLEMRTYHWESIKNIKGARGKMKRAVLQFTPASWTLVRWLDPSCTIMRFIAVCKIIIFWQISELNTFFLKHILAIETGHLINLYRLLLICVISAPSIRQYYSYVTDPQCKRVGTQCWVFCIFYSAITLTEAIICIKFGRELFARTQLVSISLWLAVLVLGSIGCVYVCVVLAQRSDVSKEITINGTVLHRYIESSAENLSNLSPETEMRHRRLEARGSQRSRRVKRDST